MIRRAVIAGAGAALCLCASACAPLPEAGERAAFIEQPAMERTLVATTGRKPARPLAAAAVGEWPTDQWWREFGCAELEAIVEQALRESHGLKKMAARLREAEGFAQVEGARLLPFIDAELGMRQSRIPNHGVVASYNPKLAGLEKTMAFINPLLLRYEFDFWGKNRAIFDAALGEAAAEEAELADAELVLTAGLARAYLRGLAFARQVSLAAEMASLRRELHQLARARFRSGLDTEDAVLAAAADVETANKREAGVRALLALQRDLIARLMGEGPDAAQNLFESRRALPAASASLPKRLPIELLAHRPDLSAALRRTEAAAERIHVAKAEFLPSIDISVAAGLEASVTSTHIGKLGSFLFRPSAFNYQAVPGVHLPIFEGGRLRGRLATKRADYDEAVELYNETLLESVRQAADSLSNWKQTGAMVDAQRRLLAAKSRELSLASIRLRSGLKDRRELLASRHALLENEFASRALEADHLVAKVDLIQALGGGYSSGLEPTAPHLEPEAPISPLEQVTPAWNLEAAAPALFSAFQNGAAE